MPDIQTVEYREIAGDTRADATPAKRGFPVYRTLFAIQAICIGIVFIAAKGWI